MATFLKKYGYFLCHNWSHWLQSSVPLNQTLRLLGHSPSRPLSHDIVFFNGPTPASFSVFCPLTANITILTTNKCEKCPSSIWDSKSQPSYYESPPLTTRPALPPDIVFFKKKWANPMFIFVIFSIQFQ